MVLGGIRRIVFDAYNVTWVESVGAPNQDGTEERKPSAIHSSRVQRIRYFLAAGGPGAPAIPHQKYAETCLKAVTLAISRLCFENKSRRNETIAKPYQRLLVGSG